jgi:hypothetical protein
LTQIDLLADALNRAQLDLKVREAGDRVKVKAKTEPSPELSLRAISAGEGWPSDVRSVLREVGHKWPSDLVAVALRFSPGAIRVLLDSGANWADSAGEIRIVRPPLFIRGFASGFRSVTTVPVEQAVRWNRSTTDIVEWLLQHPSTSVGVNEVARATGWSAALVSQVLRTLQRHGWLTSMGTGPHLKRSVNNAGSLLEAWSAGVAARPPRSRQGHVLMPSPSAFMRNELPTLLDGAPHALTGWAAASILAPYAGTIPSVQVYVESLRLARLWQRWSDSPNPSLRPVDQGANVTLLEADPHLMRHVTARDGLRIASPARVYADLLPLGGRAIDAAGHLRDIAIGF